MVQTGFRATFLCLPLVIGLVACGGSVAQESGGSGGGGGGAGAGGESGTQPKETAQSYCEGKVARDQKCNPGTATTVEACVADGDTKCLFSAVRPDVRDAIVACANGRACGTSDDSCYYDPGLTDPAPGQNEYISACQAKRTECNGGFSDDYCYVSILTSEGYASLSACLGLACSAVADCLGSGFGSLCSGP